MPEPILTAIAAALASKSAGSLYELVRRKLGKRRESAAILAAAKDKPPDSAEVRALSEELDAAEQGDPDFSSSLRFLWQEAVVTQHVARGGVANQISGNIRGNVVQANKIGDINF